MLSDLMFKAEFSLFGGSRILIHKLTHTRRARSHLKWLSAALGITAASQLFLSADLSPCIPSERRDSNACSDTSIIRHSLSKARLVT